MRKTILAALALAVFACAAASAQKTFTVANLDQFLRAIGPDRNIVMKPGTYAIKKSSSVKSQYFRWDDVADNAVQLTIQNVSNLTIKAQSSDVGIVASTPYAYVLAFENSQSISLEGLTLGHETTEPCMAGVVSFKDTSEVTVDTCDLYGSGAWGINTEGGSGITLTNTTIRDCTSAAAWLGGTTGIVFEGCTIESNAANPLFYMNNVDSVAFNNCGISNNNGAVALAIEGDPIASVDFTGCTFDNNEINLFCDQGLPVVFTDSTFSGNAFGDNPDAITGASSGGEGYEGDGEGTGPVVHVLEPAGLSFLIPPDWESQVADDGESMQMVESQTQTGVMVSAVYTIPAGGNVDQNAKKYLGEGLKGFVAFMKDQNATASVQPDGDVFDVEGLPAADFRGTGQYDQTQDLVYWVRLIISNGKVWGIIGITDTEEAVAEDAPLAGLMKSISLAQGGQ